MKAVLDEFDLRVTEVEQYLKVIERLENPQVVLQHQATGRQLRVLQEDSLKVMKATVFLLIYNVVESSIRSAFAHLYLEIKRKGTTCRKLNDNILQVWIGQQFRFDENSASLRNYRETAEKLANEIMQESAVSLSEEYLPVSGNLSANAIRKVCAAHGISVKAHYRAKGGVELETVKVQRNALAHGNTSFSACGQQYTVADLKRIKQQAFVFVRSILHNLKRFVDGQSYAKGA